MEWDLGIQGLAVLAGLAVGFGLIAALIMWNHATIWAGPIAAVVFFVAGLLISEWWFGWATEAELQPNYAGLSFDEVLLIGYSIGIPILIAIRLLAGRLEQRHGHQPMHP